MKLEREGPNFVTGLKALTLISDDRLLLADNNYLSTLDFEGEVKTRVGLNGQISDLVGLDLSKCMLTVNRSSGLQYDKETKDILLELYFFDASEELMFSPYLVRVDVFHNKIELVDLSALSDMFVHRENYGALRGVNFLRKNDSLILSNKFSSDVYLIKDGDVSKFELSSEFTSNSASALQSGFSRVEHKYMSEEFYAISYDPNQKLYFRPHKSEETSSTGISDFYMMVADEGLNKITEFKLSSEYYIFPIVSFEGVLFSAINRV